MRVRGAYGWDASPISTGAPLGRTLGRDQERRLVAGLVAGFVSGWPLQPVELRQTLSIHRRRRAAAAIGYGAPAAVGAALANRKYGRLSVSIQNDGDLKYAPGVLWTARAPPHPAADVMHNNRAYHQEVMHVQRMASSHNRDVDRAGIGTTLREPNIDYAKMAQGIGVTRKAPSPIPRISPPPSPAASQS